MLSYSAIGTLMSQAEVCIRKSAAVLHAPRCPPSGGLETHRSPRLKTEAFPLPVRAAVSPGETKAMSILSKLAAAAAAKTTI